jgi:hypothetical protein
VTELTIETGAFLQIRLEQMAQELKEHLAFKPDPRNYKAFWSKEASIQALQLRMVALRGNYHLLFRGVSCSCGLNLGGKAGDGETELAVAPGHIDSKTGQEAEVYLVADAEMGYRMFNREPINWRWCCSECKATGIPKRSEITSNYKSSHKCD